MKLRETFEQTVAGGVSDEGGAEGFAVAGGELLVGPSEVSAEAGVLLLERDVGDGAGIGVDAERDAGAVELVDAVLGVAGCGAGLHIAAGADFEMNARVGKMTHESGIFDTADAVADAGGLEVLERLPHAAGAAGFAGVGGAMKAVFDCVLEGWDVGGNRESSFVAGDVEGGDAGACELVDELRGLQALFCIEVAQGAEDEASFDTGGADALFSEAIDGGDDGFGREALIRMKQRGEAEFGVEDVVGGELFEEVFGYDAQGIFRLHKLKTAWGAGKEVGEAGALRRGDEFGVVLGAGYFRSEAGDGGVAEGAVEVKVEFDFAEAGHKCEAIYLAI